MQRIKEIALNKHGMTTPELNKHRMSNSKFYNKSLTFLLPILKMISEGLSPSDIATTLGIAKSHVSYYIGRAREKDFVTEICRGPEGRMNLPNLVKISSPCTKIT